MNYSADMQIIEFDSFETAFPVRPGKEGAVKRRFMTLFTHDSDQAQVGGTSYVCKASSFTGETFAVKRLLASAGIPKDANLTPEDAARITQGHASAFYEEYKNQLLVSRMRGFPKLYGYGMIGGDPAIVMEWVEGVSVRDLARDFAERGDVVSSKTIAAIGAAVLEVLDTAARLDSTLVHRDISPANIMIRTSETSLDEQVERGFFDVCLIDFGSAAADAPEDASFTMVSQVWRNGTPEYAPPEMLTQDIPHIDQLRKSQAIDVFALCSVLYELYAGHTPWRVGEHPELSPFRIKTEREPEEVALRDSEDALLVDTLLAGLAVDQQQRPSVRDLLAVMRQIMPASGEGAGRASAPDGLDAPIGQTWLPAGLYTPESTRLEVAGADEGGRRAGEAIVPFERPATLLTRRNFVIGGIVLAVAAAGGALVARSCQGEPGYDFSKYPTADSTYAGNALYPVMRMDDSAWILRDFDTGMEIPIGSGNREPGRFVAGLMRAFDPATGCYGFVTAVPNGSDSKTLSCAWRILPTFADAGDFSQPTEGADRLAAVQDAKSGLWGYVGENGSMRVKPSYVAATRFSNGFAAVRSPGNELWGLIDSAGGQVMPPRFIGLGSCSEAGLIAAAERSGIQWGFVNTRGEWVVADGFFQAHRFSEGLAACRREKDGLWEYIGVDGSTKIEARYLNALSFIDGLAPAQDVDTKLWGLIDATGSWHVEPRYLSLGEKAGDLYPAHGSPANVYDIYRADKAAWREYEVNNSDASFGFGLADAAGEWKVKPIYGDTLVRQPDERLCSCGIGELEVGVPVRDSVNDYSWRELSAISDEIASASGDDAALAVAKRYHLANDDGTLDGTQVKDVELASGGKARIVVVGFNHDVLLGGGRAGITFMFADAVALREMNNNAGNDKLSETISLDTVGGWNASEMRDWLNNEFVHELPADMQAVLVDVVKSSLVVPESETEFDDTGTLLISVESLIGQGVDKLWIPALVELSNVKDNSAAAKGDPYWTAPLKAEGTQYQLFADAKVSERQPNELLIRHLVSENGKACRWWLRSVEDWTFAEILEDGAIDRRDEVPTAATAQGVVPCFAL